jgi:hypothetical protein
MDETERAAWFRTKEIEWRESAVKGKEARGQQAEAAKSQKAELDTVRTKYGIEEGDFTETQRLAKAHLKRDPSTAEVIKAHRMIMVDGIIDGIPELADHPQIDRIVRDMVTFAVNNPEYTKEQMDADMKDVWGQKGTERLRSLGRKVARATQAGEDGGTNSKPKGPGADFFSDL